MSSRRNYKADKKEIWMKLRRRRYRSNFALTLYFPSLLENILKNVCSVLIHRTSQNKKKFKKIKIIRSYEAIIFCN